MSEGSRQDELRLGFLTAVEVPNRGFIGGMLVTNRFGRPLEFQCTAPVKPNRTQAVLYGPTLRPYLLGELIGKTLIKRVDVKPHLVFTELQDILEVRNHVSVPVVVLADHEIQKPYTQQLQPSQAESLPPQNTLSIGRNTLHFHQAHLEDREAVQKATAEIPREMDLSEPFKRIREALDETLQAGAA